MAPKSRGNLDFGRSLSRLVRCLQRLLGKLPNRSDYAEGNQTVQSRFQDVPALFLRLNQQLVSVFVFHVPPFFSERF